LRSTKITASWLVAPGITSTPETSTPAARSGSSTSGAATSSPTEPTNAVRRPSREQASSAVAIWPPGSRA
jgi:hypothetical protein